MIKEDVISRYDNLQESEQKKIDERLLSLFKEKLKTFEPKHKIPRGGIAPQVEWPIDAAALKM